MSTIIASHKKVGAMGPEELQRALAVAEQNGGAKSTGPEGRKQWVAFSEHARNLLDRLESLTGKGCRAAPELNLTFFLARKRREREALKRDKQDVCGRLVMA